ncbi:MAG: phage tail tape measure protein [Dyadobacter sp.]|uniref:phage tail tape measure protein n=1 Tax=Dyadobacter sp. TaxID=1914288 RepID=UPI00326302AC
MAKKVNEQAVIELIINGEKSKTTIKEVRTTMIGLERQLYNMKKEDDPAGFEKLRKQAEKVRAAHQAMVNEVRGGSGSFKDFLSNWKNITGALTGAAAAIYLFQMAFSFLPGLIATSGKLADSWADVRKQTGLAGAELTRFKDDLRSIDTRTPVEELRKLAVIAGKLGYESREDVLSFVKTANILSVALAEDLGGNIEDSLNDIGKLTQIFGLEEEFGIEKAMLKVGSAINTVGASSQANEGFLVNWAKKFAGIAPNAGISIADTIGMAAASDILGQSVELSATNIGKMIIAMGKDVPYFAKVARMSVKEFSNLLKTDGNEAFLRVLEGAKSSTKGVEGLAKTLKNLGIEGSEGAQVLGAFAKNTELVRKQQDIANASFEKGTSVIDEYNIKNQNTAAILEKIQKKLTGWMEDGAEFLNPFIQMAGKLFGVVTELDIQLEKLTAQQEKVVQVESKFPALLRRYDELKSKTNLSGVEQKELKKIIEQITDQVPEAATSFDIYGKALDINKDRVTEFIAGQKSLLEAMRQTRRELLKDELADLNERARLVQYELNLRKKYTVNSAGQTVTSDFTQEDLAIRRKEAQRLNDEIKKRTRDLAGLEGIDTIDVRRTARYGPKKPKVAENDEDNKDPDFATKDEIEKARKEREKLNEDLLKNQQQLTMGLMKEHEKELQAVQYKYDELRKRAGANAQLLTQINEQQAQDVSNITAKYNKKHLADFDKMIRAQYDHVTAAKKDELEYDQKRLDDAAKRRDKELFEINDHYVREIALAKSKGESIVALEAEWKQEVEKLAAERTKKSTDKFLEGVFDSYRSELAIADEQGSSKEEIVRSHLERLRIMREEYGALDLEQQKRINSEIAKSDRELLAIKLDQINKTGQAMSAGGQVISDVLSLAANNQNEYAEFQKALGLFQIAVDTGTAIASAVATGTKGDPYTVAARIATAVVAVTAAMLKAKQIINSTEQPGTPAFRADGGPTDLTSIQVDKSGSPAGWVSRPTLFSLGRRSYVAGEAGEEYVISQPMLRNPIVADFANMLESMRMSRTFASGGSTAMPAATPQTTQDPQLSEVIRLLKEQSKKPTGWNYSIFERYRDLIDNTRGRASA